jgi:hypothetical protein
MIAKPPQKKILQGILQMEDENKTTRGQKALNCRSRKDKESESSTESAAHTQILKEQTQPNGGNQHVPLNINTEC